MGGWLSFFNFDLDSLFSFFFILKILFMLFFFVLVRAALPRYRYDQLMQLGWKVFLPLSLSLIFFYLGFIYSFQYYILL
jgi:NADH-quinone oxidoreductase subunit H